LKLLIDLYLKLAKEQSENLLAMLQCSVSLYEWLIIHLD